MINKINSLLKKIKLPQTSIFDHSSDVSGEPCPICDEPMRSGQQIFKTIKHGRLHQKCWGIAIRRAVDEIGEKGV